jgi:hypothetical protein
MTQVEIKITNDEETVTYVAKDVLNEEITFDHHYENFGAGKYLRSTTLTLTAECLPQGRLAGVEVNIK